MILDAAGSGEAVEGYGKAAIVGLDGEIEHASALIHTLRFGNHYRTAVGAKSYLAFCNTRGGANAPIMIPLMDKNDEGRRSHYLTIQCAIPDAPAADEIVVALGLPSADVRITASVTAIRTSRSSATMPATPQRSETASGTAYAVTGSGAPLVLIHGVGMRLEAWAPQIAALSQRFEVIALDLPGHGESRPLPKGASLPDFVGRIATFLAEIDRGPVSVAGHSMVR